MDRYAATIKQSTTLILSLFLLVSYLSALSLYPVHNILHKSVEEEICQDENACHLKIVHNDLENGCDHETHVTDESIDCELCALLQLKSASETDSWSYQLAVIEQPELFVPKEVVSGGTEVTGVFQRGPPIIS